MNYETIINLQSHKKYENNLFYVKIYTRPNTVSWPETTWRENCLPVKSLASKNISESVFTLLSQCHLTDLYNTDFWGPNILTWQSLSVNYSVSMSCPRQYFVCRWNMKFLDSWATHMCVEVKLKRTHAPVPVSSHSTWICALLLLLCQRILHTVLFVGCYQACYHYIPQTMLACSHAILAPSIL